MPEYTLLWKETVPWQQQLWVSWERHKQVQQQPQGTAGDTGKSCAPQQWWVSCFLKKCPSQAPHCGNLNQVLDNFPLNRELVSTCYTLVSASSTTHFPVLAKRLGK